MFGRRRQKPPREPMLSWHDLVGEASPITFPPAPPAPPIVSWPDTPPASQEPAGAPIAAPPAPPPPPAPPAAPGVRIVIETSSAHMAEALAAMVAHLTREERVQAGAAPPPPLTPADVTPPAYTPEQTAAARQLADLAALRLRLADEHGEALRELKRRAGAQHLIRRMESTRDLIVQATER